MRTNREYWVKKIEGNMARDQRVNKELEQMGWSVARFWDIDIEKRLTECVNQVQHLVRSQVQDSQNQ